MKITTNQPLSHDKQGDQLLTSNEFGAAWQQYEQALTLREKELDPAGLQVSLDKLDGLLNKIMDESPTDAASFLEKALPIWHRLRGGNHPETAVLWHNLGYLYKTVGAWDKAVVHYKTALTIWKQTLPSDHWHLSACYHNLTVLYKVLGHFPCACTAYQKPTMPSIIA